MSSPEEPFGTPSYTRISVRHARHTDASALPDSSAARRTRPVEERPVNICEMCGAANGELETECRICGHPLATQTEPVATAAAQPQQSAAITERPAPFDDSPSLQVSSFRQPTQTGAPPMLGNAHQADPVHVEPEPKPTLPSFMQEGGRVHAAAPEPVELISANDLPDWIRQIAEADAAKAAAEAAEATPRCSSRSCGSQSARFQATFRRPDQVRRG